MCFLANFPPMIHLYSPLSVWYCWWTRASSRGKLRIDWRHSKVYSPSDSPPLHSSVNSVFTSFLLLLKGSPDPAVLSDDEDAGHTSGLHGVQRWAEGWVGFVTIQTFTLTVSFKTPIRTTTALLMTFLSKFLQQFTVYFFQSELNWAFLFRL